MTALGTKRPHDALPSPSMGNWSLTDTACHSGSTEISPVLKAMGISNEAGIGAIRFSLGKNTTKEEIDKVINKLTKI